ncbi:MAG: hypothetical protein ACXAES_15110 [Promethearchaeota archaeon]|jgi:hypothetical protein
MKVGIKNENRIKSLIISKKLCDALILLSTAVIFISLIIYINAIFFPPRRAWPAVIDFDRLKYLREIYYFIRYKFLPNMIIPSIVLIVTIIPIRILINRKFKILVNAFQKKQHQISFKHRREGIKLEDKRDFLYQTYKGM